MESLAAASTKVASRQTYYTIRLLVDRGLVEDAYRAYAYFRWLDDRLDVDRPGGWDERERAECRRLLDRQQWLLDRCLRGERADAAGPFETMLVELVGDRPPAPRLEAYLRQMMRVMDFDVRRRGRLVSAADLDDYTRSLAIAVSEAMHHFIGHGMGVTDAEERYAAVSGAHILHMLRDTDADVRAGYFNVPREVLEAYSIGPADIHCDAYRNWVAERVRAARALLDTGRTYYGRLESHRHRLAGLAYIGRFEWLIETLERDDFRLRPSYRGAFDTTAALRMSWRTIAGAAGRGGIPPAGFSRMAKGRLGRMAAGFGRLGARDGLPTLRGPRP